MFRNQNVSQEMKKSYMKYEQKQALLEFIKKHHELYFGKYSPNFTVKQSRELWQEIAVELNKIPGGCHKTWYQWRKAWHDVKNKNKTWLNAGFQSLGPRRKKINNSCTSDDEEMKSNNDSQFDDLSGSMVQFVECSENESFEYLEDCKDDINKALRSCIVNDESQVIKILPDTNSLKANESNQCIKEVANEETSKDNNKIFPIMDESFKVEYYRKKLALLERDVIAKERIASALENMQF